MRPHFNTAGSVMFLLGVGEILEEWTHKKSVGDLARSMSLNIKKVWLKKEEQEILVNSSEIIPGDVVVVHMGNVIPFDGEVSGGEGMVNQSSLTGESMPVRRVAGQSVYAGTVVEEGELEILVRAVSGSTRFEKIVTMIEDSEKLKSSLESKAEHLADRLVPYTLIGTGAVGLGAYAVYYFVRYFIVLRRSEQNTFAQFAFIGLLFFEAYSLIDTGTFIPYPIMVYVMLLTLAVEQTNDNFLPVKVRLK